MPSVGGYSSISSAAAKPGAKAGVSLGGGGYTGGGPTSGPTASHSSGGYTGGGPTSGPSHPGGSGYTGGGPTSGPSHPGGGGGYTHTGGPAIGHGSYGAAHPGGASPAGASASPHPGSVANGGHSGISMSVAARMAAIARVVADNPGYAGGTLHGLVTNNTLHSTSYTGMSSAKKLAAVNSMPGSADQGMHYGNVMKSMQELDTETEGQVQHTTKSNYGSLGSTAQLPKDQSQIPAESGIDPNEPGKDQSKIVGESDIDDMSVAPAIRATTTYQVQSATKSNLLGSGPVTTTDALGHPMHQQVFPGSITKPQTTDLGETDPGPITPNNPIMGSSISNPPGTDTAHPGESQTVTALNRARQWAANATDPHAVGVKETDSYPFLHIRARLAAYQAPSSTPGPAVPKLISSASNPDIMKYYPYAS